MNHNGETVGVEVGQLRVSDAEFIVFEKDNAPAWIQSDKTMEAQQ